MGFCIKGARGMAVNKPVKVSAWNRTKARWFKANCTTIMLQRLFLVALAED